jgi:hypothetical protein
MTVGTRKRTTLEREVADEAAAVEASVTVPGI